MVFWAEAVADFVVPLEGRGSEDQGLGGNHDVVGLVERSESKAVLEVLREWEWEGRRRRLRRERERRGS
jgi:hypothetical protein